jgi:hypothetical protein
MPEPQITARFSLSRSHHGIQRAEDALPLGQQQLTHLLHLPQRKGAGVAALPCRYYTTNPGFLFPERSEVPSQAFSFSPVFRLSSVCRSSRCGWVAWRAAALMCQPWCAALS